MVAKMKVCSCEGSCGSIAFFSFLFLASTPLHNSRFFCTSNPHIDREFRADIALSRARAKALILLLLSTFSDCSDELAGIKQKLKLLKLWSGLSWIHARGSGGGCGGLLSRSGDPLNPFKKSIFYSPDAEDAVLSYTRLLAA